ncbi:MAG: kinase [Woeseia sp.]|nr:kinase [Woeseia sp.]
MVKQSVNLTRFIQQHGLPEVFSESAERCYLPFAEWLEAQLAEKRGETYVLGINGAQGTGKSTLAQLISDYLASEHGRKVVILSIDDIYRTREERQAISRSVHPLLKTRGVPGTHDVALGAAVIKRLGSLQHDETVSVPRFDKSRDDRHAPADWPTVTGPIDLVIFEGWCVGSRATTDVELQQPVNALEASADADGRWRAYVNNKLGTEYAELFQVLDGLLFLRVPDFAAVLRWRLEQEQKLRQTAGTDATALMSDEQVADFIQHYERITRDNIKVLPSIADAVIELDIYHQAISLSYPQSDR